ncbi:MAG: hypothetical protein H6907_03005 [Hyphomicrobiales bacterium]|nr:hypothetical protein [Hyphomicrobiales bacterium]MCP5370675.1 hypothetical protein [Hyphomicrobiales bacterium]
MLGVVLGAVLGLLAPLSPHPDGNGLRLVAPAAACCGGARPPGRAAEGTGRNRVNIPRAPAPPAVRPQHTMPSGLRDAINSRLQARPPQPGVRPQTPEAVLREALGLPATGPLSPEQQGLLDRIYDTWDAIERGDIDITSLSPPTPANTDVPSLSATPQEVIDYENMVAANRARERELQDWRWWIIGKTGGLVIGLGGGGMPGAVIWNEVMSDPASDPNTMGERAEGKIKGDLAGDALGSGAGYVAGRVADRFVPGSGTMVSGAVETTVSQVMGDQIENKLKDKYQRQRQAAEAFAREHGNEVLRDTFGGPVTGPLPEQLAETMAPRTMTPKTPPPPPPVMRNADRSGGTTSSRERSIPVLRNADRSGGGGSSIPVLRASRDSTVPTMQAPTGTQVGRAADAKQAQWWPAGPVAAR